MSVHHPASPSLRLIILTFIDDALPHNAPASSSTACCLSRFPVAAATSTHDNSSSPTYPPPVPYSSPSPRASRFAADYAHSWRRLLLIIGLVSPSYLRTSLLTSTANSPHDWSSRLHSPSPSRPRHRPRPLSASADSTVPFTFDLRRSPHPRHSPYHMHTTPPRLPQALADYARSRRRRSPSTQLRALSWTDTDVGRVARAFLHRQRELELRLGLQSRELGGQEMRDGSEDMEMGLGSSGRESGEARGETILPEARRHQD
ncbi:hypothetical protein R3P38DRAFT_3230579 [Favolaschia claudopus]|uniref:Uncharacterized protein n=1 Tax=Favolaschia claudopus TaxID=2862362 RepID=A0AAV9ZM82_9AGAR